MPVGVSWIYRGVSESNYLPENDRTLVQYQPFSVHIVETTWNELTLLPLMFDGRP